MNIIHIFGIAILVVGGAASLNGDTKTDKSHQQKILLRKLQNFQETKSLTWNEFLADVLVNKIGIFSSRSQDKGDLVKNDAAISRERTLLTDFFSNIFVVYKKFIYDAFVGKRKENDDKLAATVAPLGPKSFEDKNGKVDPEEADKPTDITFVKGPKSEVEIVEPKYHGKITVEEPSTDNPGEDSVDIEKDNTGLKKKDIVDSEHNNVNPNVYPGQEENLSDCAEGFVKSENGNCVNNSSRLILAIPNQCPMGYRKDWLGYCRKVFHF